MERRAPATGWRVSNERRFLGLSRERARYLEMKLALGRGLGDWRRSMDLTQVDLAKFLGSSQSRVAKMEAADSSVSIDLVILAFLELGLTRTDIGRLISSLPETQPKRTWRPLWLRQRG